MNFVGIITEYDPFHNGHAAQLAMLRERGVNAVAVCMSAGAVQRGGIPLLPEPVRVRAALQAGADLVIALPAPYASAGAEAFAAAGVHLLAALGCDTLAFGAETPDPDRLLAAARLLDSPALQPPLREALAAGRTFAAARAAAAEALCPGTGDLLRAPNNILGIEYCKAILRHGAAMAPLPLPRLGAAHGAGVPGSHAGLPLASASYLRGAVQREGVEALASFVPAEAFALYREAASEGLLACPEKFDAALLALLRARAPGGFAGCRGTSEGLENRLETAVGAATDAEDLYARMKTKRYPHARLRRLALDAALGVQEGALPPLPPFVHVLGARRAALPRLKAVTLPVSTSLAKLGQASPEAETLCRTYSRFVDFSALCRGQTRPMGLAYTTKPVVL